MIGGGLKEHILEFKPGIGKVLDGVVDATSLNGPWTHTFPADCASGLFSGTAAGSAGSNGFTTTVSRAGGGGGASGMGVLDYPAVWLPGAALTFTLGAPSTAVTLGSATAVAAAGDLTVSGLLPTSPFLATMNSSGAFRLIGGQGVSQATGSASAAGGNGFGLTSATGGNGATNAASPPSGSAGVENASIVSNTGYRIYQHGGSGGGAASTAGTTAGANGSSYLASGGRLANLWSSFTTRSGNTDGTNSYGGGGDGGPSLFGMPGAAGIGNAAAAAGSGYGYGGSGGGGNQRGSDGGPAYLRVVYRSAQ